MHALYGIWMRFGLSPYEIYMGILGFIEWNPSGLIFRLGSIDVLWYGVLFATGLALAGIWIYRRFRENGMSDDDFEEFLIWAFLGMFLGCRLGHCLFYQWDYYSHHIVEMLLPIQQMADGSWKFTGYHGLASHGGAVGMVVAMVIFWFRRRRNLWVVMDIVAIGACLAGGFIRLGNLMNSEIVGIQTSVPWAFVFEKVDALPRHPAQLYEAIYYFVLFAVIALVYKKIRYEKVREGFYFGVMAVGIFLFRFLIEFLKEVQEDFEAVLPIDMGQILSIPFILAGLIIIFAKSRNK